MTRLVRHLLLPLSGAAIGGIALFFLIDEWPAREQWEMLMDGERASSYLTFLILFAAAMVVRGIRWNLQIGNSLRSRPRDMVLVIAWSYFLLSVIPFRIGDLVRTAWVRRWDGSMSVAIGALVSERLADAFVLTALLGFSVIVVPWGPDWVSDVGLIYVLVLGVGYFGAIVFGRHIQTWLTTKHEKIDTTGRSGRVKKSIMQLGSMVAGGLSTGGGFGTQAILLLLTILFWLLMSFAVFSVVSEFGDALHWMAGPAVISAVGLASARPAPPAGVGVYEGAAVFALTAFDMDGGIALVAAIGIHMANIFASALIGIPARIMLAVRAAPRD